MGLSVMALAIALGAGADADPVSALREGNRLFRNGQVEAAIEAYLAGYSPGDRHPTLTYNLGAAYHHLDRLPEAILWYRRTADSEDPWLQENLWLARHALGSQVLPPSGAVGWLTGHAQALRIAAVVVAWMALILLLVLPRMRPWVVLALALASGSCYATAAAAEHWGPRPAVLLEDCSTSAGELPAGSETWVRPLPGDQWQIVAGADVVCPGEAVGLVDS